MIDFVDIAEFRSAAFAPVLPEENQVNPSVYGAELAFWLCTELAKRNVATSYPEYEDWRKLFGRDKPPLSEASELVSEIQRLLESEPSVASLRWLYPA